MEIEFTGEHQFSHAYGGEILVKRNPDDEGEKRVNVGHLQPKKQGPLDDFVWQGELSFKQKREN